MFHVYICWGLYFSVCPPPQKYGQIKCWGKKWLKGDKKEGGKCIFFPQSVKSMHIVYPIDLKFTKLQKKRLVIFRLRCAPPQYNKFLFGIRYESERGRGKKFSNLICVYVKLGQLGDCHLRESFSMSVGTNMNSSGFSRTKGGGGGVNFSSAGVLKGREVAIGSNFWSRPLKFFVHPPITIY